MTKLPIFLCGAALLAAPAFAQVMAPSEYVATAGDSDLYERQSARLVLASTKDPKIRSFAHMMVMDHGKSAAMVKAAAAKSKVAAASPKLIPLQAELLTELRAETGSARRHLCRAAEGGAQSGPVGAEILGDGRDRAGAEGGGGEIV